MARSSAPTESPPAKIGSQGLPALPGRAPARLTAKSGLIEQGRRLYHTLARTLYFTVRGKPDFRRSLEYMYTIGNQSLVFLCVVMGFIGMIVVYQGGIQLQRVIPDMSQLGATFLELLVKDLAATICALMLATRVGAGIAAEIGSMTVTEQVDALRMCATDPVDYLVRPRFVASLVMTVVLVIIAGTLSALSGMWTAQMFFNVRPQVFLDFGQIDYGDICVGLSKCIAYGAAIPVISAESGLSARGGSEGVGAATTRAVVSCSLAIIVLDFFLTSVGYAIFE
jgi:phospholipid/cholesterol/gamma-HCH transport system permease protein